MIVQPAVLHKSNVSTSGEHWRQIFRALVVATLIASLSFAFRTGWRNIGADFPSYYTAARCVRQGLPLQSYYDWTWFQRQLNAAGVGTHRGVYIPQPPLTMLPFVPFATLSPMAAKRIWITINMALFLTTLAILRRTTTLRVEEISVVTLAGCVSIYLNFFYGQYYAVLLFLLTLAYYFLTRSRHIASGLVLGIALSLKLYAAPYLLFFAAKRKWSAIAGMLAAVITSIIVATAIFGWPAIAFYGEQVLPRALADGLVNPYHPDNPAISVVLRRLLWFDPDLNPHPVWNAPQTFFFIRPLLTLAILAAATLGAANSNLPLRRSFAWFTIAIFVVSPNTGFYVFMLLLLPIALLFEGVKPWQQVALLCFYALMTVRLYPPWLFPKLCLLFLLFVVLGLEHWRKIKPRWIYAAAAIVIVVAILDARQHMRSYLKEPSQHFNRIAVEQGQLSAAFPAISRSGVFFQAMGRDRYVLRWFHDKKIEELSLDGQALHPFVNDPDGPVWFELSARGTSTMMQFDPLTRTTTRGLPQMPMPGSDLRVSPNGQWVAFTSARSGSDQIYIRNRATGREEALTGGNCNNLSPAWELDSSAIVFASDCQRTLGLTGLYRAPLPHPPR